MHPVPPGARRRSQTFYARHRREPDFAMVGIVRDDDAGPIRDYVAAHSIGWPVAFDPNGSAGLGFGTTGQPETYVISPTRGRRVRHPRAGHGGRARGLAPGRASRRNLRLRRAWVPWLALAAVVVIAGVVLAARSGPSNSPAARRGAPRQRARVPGVRRRVGRRQQRAGVARDPSRHREADPRRTARRVRSAHAYVGIYGEHILSTPSNGGIGIVAWGVPIVALVLGGAGIVFAVRRWSATPRLAATADDEDVVEREREHETDTTQATTRDGHRSGGARGGA